MNLPTKSLVAIVALAHVGFMTLEMFFWQSPYAMASFNMTPEFAKATAVLAANQGLYNGFLAAGLVWGLISRPRGAGICKFFLACIIVAGGFGAATFAEIGHALDHGRLGAEGVGPRSTSTRPRTITARTGLRPSS